MKQEIKTENDFAPKSAFSAWTRGGIRLNAIVGARAVGGRSTGGSPPPRPLRPPGPTGCNGGKGGAPVAMSDATAATSDGTSDEPVRNQRRRAAEPAK